MNDTVRAWAARYQTVVLEGCDGVGKTTVAEFLVSDGEFEVVHSSITPSHLSLPQRYLAILNRSGKLVLDRSFLSEPIYGELFRGSSRLSWAEIIELCRVVTERDGVFVHLTASPSCIVRRLRERDGDAWSEQRVASVLDAYEELFTRLAVEVPVIRYATD